MKIVITGGAGFIGSHTVVALQEKGFEVIIIDDLSNSSMKVLDRIVSISGVKPLFYKTDICNYAELDKIFSDHKDITSVIHFAAFKAVGESVQQPLKYYRNNILGMVNVLEIMKVHKVNNFIFSSSATVYGQPEQLPATEETPVQSANSPYGNTKQINEDILSDAIKAQEGLKGISLRYFNPIGAHPSALIGELPIGTPNNLMPFVTQTAAGIHKELKVFGGDYNTPDGTAVRDYIHVLDLAQAHVVAMKRLFDEKNKSAYEVYNLGTGKGFSVLEVIKSFEKTSGKKLNYKIVDRREGDIEQIYASTLLANEELGWTAQLNLDEMTRSAWQWQLNLMSKDKNY